MVYLLLTLLYFDPINIKYILIIIYISFQMFENRWSYMNPLSGQSKSASNSISKLQQLVDIAGGGPGQAPSASKKSSESSSRPRTRPSRARRGKSHKVSEGCNLDAAEVARRMEIIEENRRKMFEEKW